MNSRTRNLAIVGFLVALMVAAAAVISLKPTRLGLDLAGGIELVYKVIPNTGPGHKATSDEVNKAIDVIRNRVNELGTTEAEVQSAGTDTIAVSLPQVSDPTRAKKIVGSTAQLLFYKWEDNVVVGPGRTKDRLSNKGASNDPFDSQYEAVILASKQKGSRGAKDLANDARKYPEFYYVNDKTKKVIAGPDQTAKSVRQDAAARPGFKRGRVVTVPRGITILSCIGDQNCSAVSKKGKFTKTTYYVLHDNAELTGNDIKSASSTTDPQSGTPAVSLVFTGHGGDVFHRVTRQLFQEGNREPVLPADKRNAGHRFAVALDGQVISLAFIDPTDRTLVDGIAGGRAQISNLTSSEASDLAKQINLGALPVSLKNLSQRQVSASLGKQDLHKGLIAGLVGFALVLLFLLIFYRILGVIAGIALGIYAVLFFAVAKALGFTFTLPGIAGLVLTISVAADANIVIFERIKEEVRAGRSIPASISTGYQKGFATIVDANVVTLITAFILFILATAGVRGFAASLGLGTVVSLFTAVVATSAILGLLAGWKGLERPSALGAGERRFKWRFDFMGKSKWFFTVSGMILAIGALAVAGRGLNLGIDFESGTRVTAGFVKSLSEDQVRAVYAKVGAPDAKIQRVRGDKALGANAFQITTHPLSDAKITFVHNTLDKQFKLKRNGTTEAGQQWSLNNVGPTFGASVARSAILAIIFSLLVIGVYVSLRFSGKFALPVIIALFHDLLITVGVYALVGREVSSSTVAALLTILGFSLYDTIIVFDRIRENLPRMPRAAFSQIVNRSMSEVLTRSLATSFIAGLPMLSLLIFGGQTLKDFAFALLIGTISGAYSSVFIAAPVLTHWKERENIFKQRHDRIAAENNGVVPAYYTETVAGVAVTDDHRISEVGMPEVGESPEPEVAEEPVETPNGAIGEQPAPVTSGGNISRASSKAARKAARQQRRHGRSR